MKKNNPPDLSILKKHCDEILQGYLDNGEGVTEQNEQFIDQVYRLFPELKKKYKDLL